MRKLLLAALVAGTVATPALAQEVRAPFTGARVGGLIGYDAIRPGSSEDSDLDGDDQTVDGLLYGVDVGYDFNLGSAVVGIEGEFADSTGKVEVESADPEFFGFGRVKTGRDLYIGARAGILADPQTMIYAKGGYINTQLELLASDGETELQSEFELDGFRVGAGVEREFGTNLYGKLEYRYSKYSSANFQFDDGDDFDDFDIDTDRHQAVVGVGVRF